MTDHSEVLRLARIVVDPDRHHTTTSVALATALLACHAEVARAAPVIAALLRVFDVNDDVSELREVIEAYRSGEPQPRPGEIAVRIGDAIEYEIAKLRDLTRDPRGCSCEHAEIQACAHCRAAAALAVYEAT